MYLGHFALREAPFSITPDTDFFFPHASARATLNTLLIALRSGEGFVKVVAEVGCGKTLLCRKLLKILAFESVTAYIPNPDMGPDELLLALARELRVDLGGVAGRDAVLTALQNCLLQHNVAGRRVVVCIDEAQAMPLATVERIRLLSNLETEKRKLLQLVLLGQPELDAHLAKPEIRQLLQRISFSENLGPIAPDAVGAYIQYRLNKAAKDTYTDTDVFSAQAALDIARASGGVPRLINVLAHKAMLLAYGENLHRINRQHVALAVADTPGTAHYLALARTPWWTRLWQRLRGAPAARAGAGR